MKPNYALRITASLAGLCILAAGAAHGATLCVNPGGTAGCYATISAAVSAASATSVIQVAKGIYKESVVITQPLTLAGAGAIIDATGKGVGIFVNGMSAQPAAGIWLVNIYGFTIKNANYEGILVANAVDVAISGNILDGNNKGLDYAAGTCAGLPGYETNEGADCGEAIHLMAVHHSIVSGNIITNNAGGMLLSDETGPTYENVIMGNSVTNNALDCGITLASHTPAPGLPQAPSFGVFRNTVSNNVVTNNGNIGQGAGVGIFAPGPGSANWGNVVANNVLMDNGLGGVTMHNHAAPGVGGVPAQAPGVNLNDNQIIGNRISGNGADNDDPASPGATGISILSFAPVSGTVIAQNVFSSEVADITFNAPSGLLAVHQNGFSGIEIGVDAEGNAAIDATQNWWGCPDGPGGVGCSTVLGNAVYAPSWLGAALPAPIVPQF